MKRFLAVLMAFAITVSLMPSFLFANEYDNTKVDAPIVEEVVDTQDEPVDDTTPAVLDNEDVQEADPVGENGSEIALEADSEDENAADDAESLKSQSISIQGTNGHTQAEAVAWARNMADNHVYCGECVALIQKYYAWLGVSVPNTNANTYANADHIPSGWYVDNTPSLGAVYVESNYSPGHVSIVVGIDGSGTLTTVDSNVKGTSVGQYNAQYFPWTTGRKRSDYAGVAGKSFVHPDFAPANKQPVGWLDKVEGKNGALYVKGWAYDPDEPSKQISVHIYVGGTAGSGARSYAVKANTYRQDVDNAYHCGAYHGFEETIYVSDSGSKAIYAYGIDTQGGNNPQLSGCPLTANITADTQSPKISNIKITNLNSTGYTVTCNVSDNVGVKEVTFPTWTSPDGQDDLIWHKGTISNGVASFRIKTSDHKWQSGCTYLTDIYATDYAGNVSRLNNGNTAPRVTVPNPISNIKVIDNNDTGYTVTCDVDPAWAAVRIEFPSWTTKNGQDDLVWHKGSLSNGKASCRIPAKDHGNAFCEDYLTHIYVWNSSNNSNSISAGIIVNHKLVKTPAKSATTSSEGNIEYWTCSGCGKIFKDAFGKTEITKAQTVTPKVKQTITPSASSDVQNLIVDLPAVKVSKPKAAKKAATVKWKKVSKKNQKKIKGIEIQVATDPGFTQIVKSATAGKKKTSKKIKGLQSKKTYYVRIRAYKNAADGKHVSNWSKIKKVKIK